MQQAALVVVILPDHRRALKYAGRAGFEHLLEHVGKLA